MAYVILRSCCNDASCVAVCPVDCIHPTPEEPGFMQAEMLHIDPATCIDCGACVDECPVDAIRPEDELEEGQEVYLDLNAEYFEKHPVGGERLEKPKPWRKNDFSALRVAIVGSGPSAFYTALELQSLKVGRIDMFDRLLTPYGLARFGVAPDHQSTKAVIDVFRSIGSKKNFNLHLGVEVGDRITHAELLEHHDAVVYAVGASADRGLGVEGEDLPGSHAATEFVAWYNGHPDSADRTFDLSGTRAVIVGNGNVALDAARILLADIAYLERTDIAQHALDALRTSNIREVVVVGRRGVAQAAYTNPEMLSLRDLENVDIVIEGDEVATDEVTQLMLDADETEASVHFKVRLAQETATEHASGSSKRLVLRYLRSPHRIVGEQRVESIDLVRNRLEIDDDRNVVAVPDGHIETLETGLVLRSVGYRGAASVPGLPFDEASGVIPNIHGRVIESRSRELVPGVYVAGWIKRGPTGVIGTNKKCAIETVDNLLQDYADGVLSNPKQQFGAIQDLVAERHPDALTFEDWSRIDRAEREAGKKLSRPRVKLVDQRAMLALAHRK